MMPASTPSELTAHDLLTDTILRDFRTLDKALHHIEKRSRRAEGDTLVDLGCGYGGVTAYIADRLRIAEAHGLDRNTDRLKVARGRGVTPHRVDLEHDRFPFADSSVDLVLSFGAFEHLVWYDNVLSEAARILRDRRCLVISLPNLGSYINRTALLFGYQPRNVEVSRRFPAGVLPQHGQKPLTHIRSATLRAMRDLLVHHGFNIERTYGSSPDFGSGAINLFDRILSFFPSISRRYLIIAHRDDR